MGDVYIIPLHSILLCATVLDSTLCSTLLGSAPVILNSTASEKAILSVLRPGRCENRWRDNVAALQGSVQPTAIELLGRSGATLHHLQASSVGHTEPLSTSLLPASASRHIATKLLIYSISSHLVSWMCTDAQTVFRARKMEFSLAAEGMLLHVPFHMLWFIYLPCPEDGPNVQVSHPKMRKISSPCWSLGCVHLFQDEGSFAFIF